MSKALRLILGFLLVVAGLVGLWIWRWGSFTPDNGMGIFMLSVIGLLAGAHGLLGAIGVNLFGREGSGDSGTSLFDGDSDGDGGGDGGD